MIEGLNGSTAQVVEGGCRNETRAMRMHVDGVRGVVGCAELAKSFLQGGFRPRRVACRIFFEFDFGAGADPFVIGEAQCVACVYFT